MANLIFRAIIAIAIGYFLGSIPSGLIVTNKLGVDVRKVGSGKTGATNVLRSSGLKPALIVALADVLKGLLPTVFAMHFIASPAALGNFHAWTPWIVGITGLAAIAGHNYPIYVGFKGGRGVATTAGVSFGISWQATLISAVFFFVPIVKTRYVSLGSMVGAASLPIIELVFLVTHTFGAQPAYVLTLAVAAAAIIISHKDNIDRIRRGVERKIGEKVSPKATA